MPVYFPRGEHDSFYRPVRVLALERSGPEENPD
jgi:hypothetical protein